MDCEWDIFILENVTYLELKSNSPKNEINGYSFLTSWSNSLRFISPNQARDSWLERWKDEE